MEAVRQLSGQAVETFGDFLVLKRHGVLEAPPIITKVPYLVPHVAAFMSVLRTDNTPAVDALPNFSVFKRNRKWVHAEYARSGVFSNLDRGTLGRVFLFPSRDRAAGERDRRASLRPGYIDLVLAQLLTRGPIRLADIAIWACRTEQFADPDNLASVINHFLAEYHISDAERLRFFTEPEEPFADPFKPGPPDSDALANDLLAAFPHNTAEAPLVQIPGPEEPESDEQGADEPPALSVRIADLTLAILKSAIEQNDPELQFSDSLLAAVVAALRAADGKSFILLRGVSGTGKSRLVAAIAKALYGIKRVPAPWLTMIEVRPDWTDGSPLLGHYATIEDRYVRRPFLDAVIAATAQQDFPVIVCLDEMNLARVEYYLAEFLSAMESGLPIMLDRRIDEMVPAGINWPSNLCLFGTINVDETTFHLSDKVLDRAQVIDTSDIDLVGPLNVWVEQADGLTADEKTQVREVITAIWEILRRAGAPFGFRTARALVRFVAEAKMSSGGALGVSAALDAQMRQKVLVKLRGEGELWSTALEALEVELTKLKGSSAALVARMRVDLERMGSFEFWS